MEDKFQKGLEGEKFVQNLACKSFLTDWCYLNPKWPNGKEMCDLLVVFDSVAIIWQIKNVKLGKDNSYNKSEIEKNSKQLLGARRHLFHLKKALTLENPRRGRESFKPEKIKEVFLISVMLGDKEDMYYLHEVQNGHNIHIFSNDFTEIILRELNTISDFLEYLRSKELLYRQNSVMAITGGEEELLAIYLSGGRSFKDLADKDLIVIDEGHWKKHINSSEYKNKKEQDNISFCWDSFIDRAHEGSKEYEKIARELARPAHQFDENTHQLVPPKNLKEALRNIGRKPRIEKTKGVVAQLCAWKALSAEELTNLLGKKDKKYLVRNILNPMIDEQILTYTYPEMTNHPKQKYQSLLS